MPAIESIIAEVELEEYERRIYQWMVDGYSAYEVARMLCMRKQRVCRAFALVRQKIIEAVAEAGEGRVSVKVTVAKGHDAYSLTDTTVADVLFPRRHPTKVRPKGVGFWESNKER